MSGIKKYKKDIIIFMIPFTVFFVLFLGYFPGIIPFDGAYQWSQVESGMLNNDHPFLSTYFMYLLSKIWRSPKVIMLFQMFIFSFFWSIFCNKFRNKFNFKKQVLYTLFICLIPLISLYSFTVWKDVLYSYYMIMLAFITYDIGKRHFAIRWLDVLYLGLLLFLIFSYRFNGMLVSILYIFMLMFLLVKYNKKYLKRFFMIIVIVVSLLGVLSFPKNYYINRYNKVNSSSDDISLGTVDYYITWIFGNYIKNGVIDSRDKLFLNEVINLKHWKKSYNGYLVNSTYIPDEVDEQYVIRNEDNYHNLFMKYVFKYPNLLVDHYLMSDSLLISLDSIDHGYVYVFPFTGWDYLNFDGMIHSRIPLLEKIYTKIINFSFSSILKYFYQPGAILYLCIILVLILTKKYNDKNAYLIIMPMILNTLSLLPVNLAQDLRYVYINYLTLCLLGLIYFCIDKGGAVMKNAIDNNINKKNFKVLMIIPAYNEEKAILNTVNKIRKYNTDNGTNYDVLVINDGSVDKTGFICKSNDIKTINLVHNLGIGGAVQTGYKYAYAHDYDIAIQFDGDGQHDVNYVKDLINPIINDGKNFVIGSRFIKLDKNNFNSSFSRRIGIKVISFFIKKTSGKKIYDTTSGFRAADRSVINYFANNYPLEYPEPITTVELVKMGYEVDEVPVKMNERDGGTSSIHSWKNVYYMVNVILSILLVGSRRYK